MFKRRWFGLGRLVSDEGFEVFFSHKTVSYRDSRGTFQFGYEGELLFPASLYQVEGEGVTLNKLEREVMVDRVVRGIRANGSAVEVFSE